VAAHATAGKEIAGAAPGTVVVGYAMLAILPSKRDMELFETDSIWFFGVELGLLDFPDHP
jgi:hypothetical protein